mgnify:CR=1 FL=1
MLMGSLIVAACLIVLGWTKEIVGIFIGDPETLKTCSIAVAVLSIYALDFAVNAGELGYNMANFHAASLYEC